MKIKIKAGIFGEYYRYMNTSNNQKQYDYMYKNLDFDKLNKSYNVFLENDKIWQHKKINHECLSTISKYFKDDYQLLKNNWGKGIFRVFIEYSDKQELKSIVNRVMNIGFMVCK